MKKDPCNEERAALAASIVNLKVIAFDCDGVLFDSREANIQFYNHIMEAIGRPPIREDQQEYVHMHAVRESLIYLTGGDGVDFQRSYQFFQTIDFGPFNGYLSCEPGLIPFLELVSGRFRIALATNRTVSTVELLREFNLDKYFDLVVCASDVANPKPHPDIMERIFTAFAVSPEHVLYIGDSKVDEAIALATGVHFISYKNPSLTAELHIDHFDELNRLFLENGDQLTGTSA